MKVTFYKIECITNLHVGSGDINYNIVDNEVEKDITGLPMIHASGIKGALRDAVAENNPALAEKVFGMRGKDKESCNAGTHKFLDAYLISRPMRVSGGDSMASIPVTSVSALNHFLSTLTAFGCNKFGIESVPQPDFKGNNFLATCDVKVEGDSTAKFDGAVFNKIIKGDFAIAKSFDDYDLPVVARNCLEEDHKNLWYEEIVPHGSVFFFGIISPDGDDSFTVPELVQLGGNASIGCGYCKITPIGGSTI